MKTRNNGFLSFANTFPTEESCMKYLEILRWKNGVVSPFDKKSKLEKPRDFDPFGQTGFAPFGYNMIDPLKSWCWGSILFYPFKISRFP